MLFLAVSCNKTEDVTQNQSIIDASIRLSLVNAENEDLLNPLIENHYDTADIKIYYLMNGQVEYAYNSQYNYPKNFRIFHYESGYSIAVFLNTIETDEKPVTYIHWNETDIDTVEVEYKRSPNSLIIDKIWLNGEFIWSRVDTSTEAYFVLVK